MAITKKEFGDGLVFWGKRRWPADLHNANYETWAAVNPNGNFTVDWWNGFLPTLRAWRATRPKSSEQLTSRFLDLSGSLKQLWKGSCEPHMDADITTVSWSDVEDFPGGVAEIKGVQSPVFTSKFCHFLLPKVFPVVDNAAMGNRWRSYGAYFAVVQDEWKSTDVDVRSDLEMALGAQVRSTGSEPSSAFPTVTKIVELGLIGRRNPV